LRTVVMFSACTVEGSASPVSAGARAMCVGRRGGVVESGTTKTVVARSCALRASMETMTTGRSFLSGGSGGSLTNQISPRCGDRVDLGVGIGLAHARLRLRCRQNSRSLDYAGLAAARQSCFARDDKFFFTCAFCICFSTSVSLHLFTLSLLLFLLLLHLLGFTFAAASYLNDLAYICDSENFPHCSSFFVSVSESES
jgi:hypothetical protein